ncbi:uncharacterized protein PHALS_07971 [Plasmopara halstedii]|uniref:Uncharacterized protein n=1 Tax=Plasmopara halstedii TaxID=4781 RepID=A0A0P1B8B9_PLAHL|nr:uncharacterized protein PHALS_07971 [Plasmopara halstedii]CEG50247.1 hypothetical protein PHALS_07971 [Plasmopara halstedii]|eukprot:XP_024586616.1 hypothetical protein PHALS_07971 [Plasmopara halstedii]
MTVAHEAYVSNISALFAPIYSNFTSTSVDKNNKKNMSSEVVLTQCMTLQRWPPRRATEV